MAHDLKKRDSSGRHIISHWPMIDPKFYQITIDSRPFGPILRTEEDAAAVARWLRKLSREDAARLVAMTWEVY